MGLAEGHSRQLIRIDSLRFEVVHHRNRARGGQIPIVWEASGERLVVGEALNHNSFAVEALQDR